VAAVFLLRFLDVHGLRPQTDACVVCEAPAGSMARMCIGAEGIVCEGHNPLAYRPVSPGVITAMQFILDSDLPRSFQFTAADDMIMGLRNVADLLCKYHFEWDLKTGG
jgi:recombinational DNA repair protein (RecF pathway)